MEPKYKLGDVVYFMHENKVHHSYIKEIRHGCVQICGIQRDIDREYIQYNVTDRDIDKYFDEKDLFETKQELIDSL